MKRSTLALISLLTFSQAYARDISPTCDITKNQIKDLLTKKSLSFRQKEKEMLRMLSPEIDKIKLGDLLQDIQDNKYVDRVISYEEEKRLEELLEKKSDSLLLPSEEELSRYNDITYKSDASKSELEDLQAITRKISRAKARGIDPMTEAEKAELSALEMKWDEHKALKAKSVQPEFNLNNYVRSEIFKKFSSNPDVKVIKNDYDREIVSLKNERMDVTFNKESFDKEEYSGQSGLGMFTLSFENKIDGMFPDKYIIQAHRHSIGMHTFFVNKDNEFNKALKEIVFNTKKTWSDFGMYGDHEVVNLHGDVKSSMDIVSGEITAQYKVWIINESDEYRALSSDFVPLEEMTELLMPKECKVDSKDSASDSSISNSSRNNNKDSDASEEKKGWLKKLFDKKSSKQ